jgi:uncharacterized integral membrane protein
MSTVSGGDRPAGVTTRRGPRFTPGAVASLSGGALLVIFMAQNTEKVKVHLLFWSFTWPVWLLTIVTAVVGAVVWLGLGVLRRHRRRRERRQDRRG